MKQKKLRSIKISFSYRGSATKRELREAVRAALQSIEGIEAGVNVEESSSVLDNVTEVEAKPLPPRTKK